jgi:hypothetical protein
MRPLAADISADCHAGTFSLPPRDEPAFSRQPPSAEIYYFHAAIPGHASRRISYDAPASAFVMPAADFHAPPSFTMALS